ncbi:hypothetical protein E1B28_004103 [Marasmius oreades]|uniref:Uncharacterized protein n=1 Tax=Marasmius oreades TaxID=181124 RepID=A0A9P8ACH7_9AGAR|nr:uncharacterized protein E1B28_004103 [Marasmius oreades]KAG7096689.1 hypothetical protein E1B28_004103 [Marasmius oreades]
MPLGEPAISTYFERKRKENVRPTKRKRGDAETTITTDRSCSPSPKRQKQRTSVHPRRQVFNDKDSYVNRPPTTSSRSPVLPLPKRTSISPTHVHTLSAAKYPTPKSTVKNTNTRRESQVIDLTNDDEPSSSLSRSFTIRSPVRRSRLVTPKTPIRRRRVPSDIVPETPSHKVSPVRPLHLAIPSRRSTTQSLSEEGSSVSTSLEGIAPSSQPKDLEEITSQLQEFVASKSSLGRGSSEIVPSSQSQEREFDPSYFATLRARRLTLEDQDIVPSSQSQSQPQYWPREANHESTGNNGNEPKEFDLPDRSPDISFSSNSLQRSDSNVSFIMPIEDTDISSLFEGDPMFLAAQDVAAEDVPPLKPLSQAISATESDSGDEEWLQNVGDRTAIGHAVSQRPQQSSPPRSVYRSQEPVESRGFVASRSCTPEWPSQLTLTGCDVDSSQWSLPQDATDFLDMVESRPRV